MKEGEMLRALKRVWKEIKQIEVIKGLIIIAIIMPVILWEFKLVFDAFRGTYDCKGSFDSNWLSFFGSYLGGLLGGIATLIAVVYTINNNKIEQSIKKENEKKKKIQKSALIVYYDLTFAFDNIKEFISAYMNKCGKKRYLDSIKTGSVDYKKYSACLARFDQFYFYSDWISAVATLNNHSMVGKSTIKQIYETYGNLMTVKKSVETPNVITCKTAFISMNKLIDAKTLEENNEQSNTQEVSKEDIRINDDNLKILNLLEELAFGKSLDSTI